MWDIGEVRARMRRGRIKELQVFIPLKLYLGEGLCKLLGSYTFYWVALIY